MSYLEYIHCPTCGLTLEEIREEHKIGCQDCLVVFREAIEQILLEKIGSITYGGQYVVRKQGDKLLENSALSDVSKNASVIYSIRVPNQKSELKLTRDELQASLLELKRLLEKSVAAEDYEAAIYFRNEIKRLEQV